MDKIIHIISQYININIIGYILLFPLVILWVWSILYTAKDISHRTDNIFYQVLCIIIVSVGTPFIGFPLYFILRPYRTLDDINWRKSIEVLGKECSECGTINHKDNKFCIACGEKLDIKCKECGKEYSILYDYCPYCGAPNLENE